MLGELRLTRGKKKSIGFVGFFGVSLIYSVWFSQALLCTAFHASVLWVLILPLYSRKCGQVISQESPALQARLNFGLTEARKCFFFCFRTLCVSLESLVGGGEANSAVSEIYPPVR